jgi:hypothetical protein
VSPLIVTSEIVAVPPVHFGFGPQSKVELDPRVFAGLSLPTVLHYVPFDDNPLRVYFVGNRDSYSCAAGVSASVSSNCPMAAR